MINRKRTTKCGPITSDMSWQEVLLEYGKLNENNADVMSLSVEDGFVFKVPCSRRMIIRSFHLFQKA